MDVGACIRVVDKTERRGYLWRQGIILAGPDLPVWIYVVYSILLTVGAAALLIPIASSVRNEKQFWSQIRKPIIRMMTSTGENGWYNNPDDRHILVRTGSTA